MGNAQHSLMMTATMKPVDDTMEMYHEDNIHLVPAFSEFRGTRKLRQ